VSYVTSGGQVFEVVGERGEWYWLERASDGVLVTLPKGATAPYERVPALGEIWRDADEVEHVIVGVLPEGRFATVPVVAPEWDPAADGGKVKIDRHRPADLVRPRKAANRRPGPSPDPVTEPAEELEPTPEPELEQPAEPDVVAPEPRRRPS